MSLINKRYANYYNTKYRQSGHVYEKRFYDKMIEDKVGMLAFSRYIHLNPVEANMVSLPEYYPWSSYIYYKNENVTAPSYINMGSLLDYYEGTGCRRRKSTVPHWLKPFIHCRRGTRSQVPDPSKIRMTNNNK
jgi:putative transposase